MDIYPYNLQHALDHQRLKTSYRINGADMFRAGMRIGAITLVTVYRDSDTFEATGNDGKTYTLDDLIALVNAE